MEPDVFLNSSLPSSKKRILIITVTDLQTDPMPYRQIKHLREEFDLTTIGLKPSEFSDVKFVPIRLSPVRLKDKLFRLFLLLIRQYDRYYRERFDFRDANQKFEGSDFNAVIAHDDEMVPLALRINQGRRVIYDAHEYTPSEKESSLSWRLTQLRYKDWLCKTYLNRCAALITVSEGIAKKYEENYDVKSDVILNASDYFDLAPSPLIPKRIRLIHHGVAAPLRRIEDMIEMADFLDERYSLDLMLLPAEKEYYHSLQERVNGHRSVRILNPVPMKELVPRTNGYDLGIFTTYPSTFNLRYSLPNKFFEYLQARLGVVIGPYPELSQYVTKYRCGLVADSFEPKVIAKMLNDLDEKTLWQMKTNAHEAAKELTSTKSMEKLRSVLSRVM